MERKRFLRVIYDWLVDGLMGCAPPELDEYEKWLKQKGAVTKARRDREFREFLNTATTFGGGRAQA